MAAPRNTMRKHGSTSDYIPDRNNALLRAYRHAMAAPGTIDRRKIVAAVVDTPCKRFWVSEEQATVVIRHMLAGKPLATSTPTRREMFHEIFRRVTALRRDKPGLTIADAVFKVVNSPAPKFYLTPKSAYVIIQRAKKKCYEERKQRLQHFLRGQQSSHSR